MQSSNNPYSAQKYEVPQTRQLYPDGLQLININDPTPDDRKVDERLHTFGGSVDDYDESNDYSSTIIERRPMNYNDNNYERINDNDVRFCFQCRKICSKKTLSLFVKSKYFLMAILFL